MSATSLLDRPPTRQADPWNHHIRGPRDAAVYVQDFFRHALGDQDAANALTDLLHAVHSNPQRFLDEIEEQIGLLPPAYAESAGPWEYETDALGGTPLASCAAVDAVFAGIDLDHEMARG